MNTVKKNTMLAVLILITLACSEQNIPEKLVITEKVERSEEYYENLRAWKKTDHQITFGWYGDWTATGASASKWLTSTPDSMDIISIWGGDRYHSLTKEKIADKKYVQEVLGTRITFTIFSMNVGLGFENTDEGIVSYVNALKDTITKYDYDGLDLDYEPSYRSFFGDMNQMAKFVKELGKYLGPKSGTGKLLIIDGHIMGLLPGLGEYFDYGIVQTYGRNRPAFLQTTYNLSANNFPTTRFVVTEDFSAYGSSGGVIYTDEEGNTMPSLLGMAYWQPEQGRKGGVGAFIINMDYMNNPDYKYMRKAIQIMNPAKK